MNTAGDSQERLVVDEFEDLKGFSQKMARGRFGRTTKRTGI